MTWIWYELTASGRRSVWLSSLPHQAIGGGVARATVTVKSTAASASTRTDSLLIALVIALTRPTARALGLGAAALGLEAARAGGGGRLRGSAPARYAQGLAQRLHEPRDRQLAVPPLAALVLGEGALHRSGLRDHASLLSRRQRCRGLDVEDRLDATLGPLCVLAARPARAREAQLDLGERDRDRPGHPNRLALHGGNSAGRRRRFSHLRRADPGWSGRRAAVARERASPALRDGHDDSLPRRDGRGAAAARHLARGGRDPDNGRRRRSRARRPARARARDGRDRLRPRGDGARR